MPEDEVIEEVKEEDLKPIIIEEPEEIVIKPKAKPKPKVKSKPIRRTKEVSFQILLEFLGCYYINYLYYLYL